jgi:hypothetical protein
VNVSVPQGSCSLTEILERVSRVRWFKWLVCGRCPPQTSATTALWLRDWGSHINEKLGYLWDLTPCSVVDFLCDKL